MVPFDEIHLKNQIETQGGFVIPEFDLDMVQTADQSFIISDTFQRTNNYFHFLAAGLPCVSYKWVIDCCAQVRFMLLHSHFI